MCGVIGLVCENHRVDMGRVAGELLRQLEYRGYDSTGAAIQGKGTEIQLAKGVGAPSAIVDELGITAMAGSILCGQVRWATFGAVNAVNAQPHAMRCKTLFYGAHNGNVTNCDDLKAWLESEGHQVLSDNDGEMVVHTVEHYFALELAALPEAKRNDSESRRLAMRAAVAMGARKLRGSYAAVVVDPEARRLYAIKQGSSLYFGIGRDETGGEFAIASSDLSAVLRMTRVLLPLSEGEFVEFAPGEHQVLRLNGDSPPTPVTRNVVRSRLRAKDTALVPPYRTFMEQEIAAQEDTCRDVITAFSGGSADARALESFFASLPEDDAAALHAGLDSLRGHTSDEALLGAFRELTGSKSFVAVRARLTPEHVKILATGGTDRLASAEAGFFADLSGLARSLDAVPAIRLLDLFVEHGEVAEYEVAVTRFCRMLDETIARRGRVFALCCGSSYHAARAASLFFDAIAGIEIAAVLPGEFRGQHARSIEDGDLVIVVSQSGETKDVIDVLNDIAASERKVGRVALVNNVNSTLAQEKSDVVIPLRCGVEVAVPATKSFMNQLVVFYCLALRAARTSASANAPALAERAAKLGRLPLLIRETLETTGAAIHEAAALLCLAPSMQILATRLVAVAKEGALKVREVVLNHTEGFEGSEFKHGPNTILGVNTLYGPREVAALLREVSRQITAASRSDGDAAGRATAEVVRAIVEAPFAPDDAMLALPEAERTKLAASLDRSAMLATLKSDYPLVYVTGPDERDVGLTVSQINTHKIRGSLTIIVAEENAALRQAAEKVPANNPGYRSVYIPLPRCGDTLLTTFSATVVLQRLALEMSTMKASYLDRIGLADHGVHPDVPKNVSKSITVD